MNELLFSALIPLVLVASLGGVHATRKVKIRRQCRQMMRAHRDMYQRFLVEHAKA